MFRVLAKRDALLKEECFFLNVIKYDKHQTKDCKIHLKRDTSGPGVLECKPNSFHGDNGSQKATHVTEVWLFMPELCFAVKKAGKVLFRKKKLPSAWIFNFVAFSRGTF